jgi:hypothetical protein
VVGNLAAAVGAIYAPASEAKAKNLEEASNKGVLVGVTTDFRLVAEEWGFLEKVGFDCHF